MNTKKHKWDSSYPRNRKVQYPVCVSFDRDVEYLWWQDDIHQEYHERRDWLTRENVPFEVSMQELNDDGEVIPATTTGKYTSWRRHQPKLYSWQVSSLTLVYTTQTNVWRTLNPPVLHTKKMRYNFFFRNEADAMHFKLVWM